MLYVFNFFLVVKGYVMSNTLANNAQQG